MVKDNYTCLLIDFITSSSVRHTLISIYVFNNLIFFRSSESKVAEIVPAPSIASGDEHKQRGEESVPHGLPNGDVKSLGGKQAPPVVSINSSVDREGATSPRGQVSELNTYK